MADASFSELVAKHTVSVNGRSAYWSPACRSVAVVVEDKGASLWQRKPAGDWMMVMKMSGRKAADTLVTMGIMRMRRATR